uniref:Molybdopterin synthase catalytic subunit n=1 Tax=Cynoglossus semilaevis TaxID=244447 RepID=A0A3P8VTJ7_CYNSE
NFEPRLLPSTNLCALCSSNSLGEIPRVVLSSFFLLNNLGLEYEAYELMAQSKFVKVCADIRQCWPTVVHICVHHRLGWVKVREASVVMAISSPHRHDGHQAIQHCISQLKAKIPIWKKEVYDTQEVSWKLSECSWSLHSKVHNENGNLSE